MGAGNRSCFCENTIRTRKIARFYRAASVCLVTSLHDGMNLVAKEFVASREDERGALVLSTFAGAALELTDALQVNPYDVQQLRAIFRSLEMRRRSKQRVCGTCGKTSVNTTSIAGRQTCFPI